MAASYFIQHYKNNGGKRSLVFDAGKKLFDLTKNIAVMRYINDDSHDNQIYAIVTDSVKNKLNNLFEVYISIDFDSTFGEMITTWGEYVYKKNDVEICFELNYTSAEHFFTTFKKRTGYTPTEYRNFGKGLKTEETYE